MKRSLVCSSFVLVLSVVAVLAWYSPPAHAQENDVCFMCHADAETFDGPRAAALTVAEGALDGSVHGGFSCVDCHQDLMGVDDFPHAEKLEIPTCSPCHDDVKDVFDNSLHGYARARGNPRAPTCISCHGSHDVLRSRDPHSRTHKVKLMETCASCHGEAGLLTDHIVKLPQSFTDYADSVHGKGTERGIAAAAACADCHGVHDLRGPADPQSSINIQNVAATCGQCHPDIQVEYERSIHGRALAAGVTDSPTCTGCHGEHLILSPTDPDANVSAGHQAIDTCGRCHNDPVIIAKYNLKGTVVDTYVDSYHGWATQLRSQAAATCVDCHSAHSVLPEQSPESTVHADNVVSTCQKCHPNSDAKFAASYTHESTSITANPINRILRSVYIWLIVVVIGGMVLHNLVIMNFYMVERRRAEANSPWVQRFDKSQIAQHMLLTLTFVGLVITGFALRFPDAWWVHYLSRIGMTEDVRANLHRVCAIGMCLVGIAHVWYVFLTRRGRRELQAMVPALSDIRGLGQNLGYHTWFSKQPARFGRYDYSQKAEYWALIWGTFIMVLTGFVLWVPEFFVRWLPSWIVSASQIVHYYEAWLATLAILVWHIFFVMFHPEQYPMSWTWLTGKMSLESVKHHHRAWYDEELAQQDPGHGKEDQREVAQATDPPPPARAHG